MSTMTLQGQAQVHEADTPLGHANTQLVLSHVKQRLVRAFGPSVNEAVVRTRVHDAETALRQPRISHFVPILVERDARRRILASVADQGTVAGVDQDHGR